jgi:hypothetical protein
MKPAAAATPKVGDRLLAVIISLGIAEIGLVDLY